MKDSLTRYRPAPIGNRNIYLRGSKFSTVTIKKPGLKQANTSMSVPQLHYINGLYNTRGIGKPQKKTGPEEAQYFHVRPPIGFI